jgi:NADPH:quinone reductase-like Zn-dependent oxidoreductase
MDGALVGCDFAGVVEEVGGSVSKHWQKGDHICGVVHGCNLVQPEDGAFAEFIVAKGDVQMRKPQCLSYAQASTVALGAITCGQGLYQKGLGLELPTNPVATKEYVLVYGGGTSVGGLAIQFAKLYERLDMPFSSAVLKDHILQLWIFCDHYL